MEIKVSCFEDEKINKIESIKSTLVKSDDAHSETIEKKNENKLKESEPEIMKDCVLKPGFEKQYTVPPYVENKRKIKRERKKEREKTSGPGWYHLSAPEMTTEIKNDLIALQMRHIWDRKSFYKKNDLKTFPKYFQIGTIVETPADYYHSRIPKKQRKRTIVEELLADEEFKRCRYNKKKAQEIIASKPFKRRIKKNK